MKNRHYVNNRVQPTVFLSDPPDISVYCDGEITSEEARVLPNPEVKPKSWKKRGLITLSAGATRKYALVRDIVHTDGLHESHAEIQFKSDDPLILDELRVDLLEAIVDVIPPP